MAETKVDILLKGLRSQNVGEAALGSIRTMFQQQMRLVAAMKGALDKSNLQLQSQNTELIALRNEAVHNAALLRLASRLIDNTDGKSQSPGWFSMREEYGTLRRRST